MIYNEAAQLETGIKGRTSYTDINTTQRLQGLKSVLACSDENLSALMGSDEMNLNDGQGTQNSLSLKFLDKKRGQKNQ
jgi:hypothetical protein